jgi:ABC-type glycerol-3-phosphate transport system substrate-binding protein
MYYEIFWGAGYGVNKNSHHLDEAKKFLEFLMTPVAASLWAVHVQSPYPVITKEWHSGTLYGSLMQLRDHHQAFPKNFSCPGFKTKAINNMWVEEAQKFITGEHSVEEFVERMNSRIEFRN